MASNGSFNTSSYKNLSLLFSWEIKSQSIENNTTTISWSLKGHRTDGATGYITCGGFKVVINGKTVYSKSTDYRVDVYNGTVIASGTETIPHNSDGTKSFSASAEGAIYYSTVNSSGEGTWTLTPIARASEITALGNITLGNKCSVKWTPKSAAYRYKIKFVIGKWSDTTGVIHPNTTNEYTYTGYTIPLDAANQITDAKTGTLSATLYTYSDSGGTAQVGYESTKTSTAKVPDNSQTKPSVSMTLSPVGALPDAFSGLYIQGKTRVKAAFTGSGKYGASIASYGMTVEGKGYYGASDYTSEYLSQYGEIKVNGYAADSRDYVGSVGMTIPVISYAKPKIQPISGESGVVAARCDGDGNISDSGTYLKIKAKRVYSKVVSDGVQKNFCRIRYRYRADASGNWSGWTTILESTAESDEVTTGALLDGALAVNTTYLVQVQASDDIGEDGSTTISVPTEKIYMHRNGAMEAIGFGTYVSESNLMDLAWRFRGREAATFDKTINGMYLKKADFRYGADSFRMQTYLTAFDGTGGNRQTVFLFGTANHTPILGMLEIEDSGTVRYVGQGTITASPEDGGIVLVTLPEKAWDEFLFMSSKYFEIL